MGRRRINAPRRGSLAYLPRGRAPRPVGRIRHWPNFKVEKPTLLGFVGYKVGMNFIYFLGDTRGNPTFGQEIHSPVTIVETPAMVLCGFRGYSQTLSTLRPITEVWAQKYPKDLDRLLTLPKREETKEKQIPLEELTEIRAILSTQPHQSGLGGKKPELLEVKVAGGSMVDQLAYVKDLLGKEVQVSQVFKEGQYVDVVGVTKGKGIQGPVRRWGVKTLQHKSRKTVRGVGTLGPWTPHYVMYTVPRAGQTGFHQRTEFNKRVLKIGADGETVNPKGGFQHYGLVRRNYVVLSGSLPGPAKRALKLRYAVRPPSVLEAVVPKVTFSGIGKSQGV